MKQNLTEEHKKKIALKIIRGHLKLITKCVNICFERLARLEETKDPKDSVKD